MFILRSVAIVLARTSKAHVVSVRSAGPSECQLLSCLVVSPAKDQASRSIEVLPATPSWDSKRQHERKACDVKICRPNLAAHRPRLDLDSCERMGHLWSRKHIQPPTTRPALTPKQDFDHRRIPPHTY